MTAPAKTRFTPGPWTMENRDTGHGQDASRFVGAEHAPIGHRLPAVTHGPNRVANAHLIAAAPDLYAALKLYVEHYGDPLKVARAALSKADGDPR